MRERTRLSRKQHMGKYRYMKEISQAEKDALELANIQYELLSLFPLEYFDGQQPSEFRDLQKNAIVRCTVECVYPPIIRYEVTQIGKDALKFLERLP